MDCSDSENSILSFVRRGRSDKELLFAVFNLTPIPRHNYRIGVPRPGFWRELLNSDSTSYGGSGQGNIGGVEAFPVAAHGQAQSLNLVLPPLAALFFKIDGDSR